MYDNNMQYNAPAPGTLPPGSGQIKKSKNPAKALLWLLMIPIQLIIDVVIFVVGVMMDANLFSDPSPDVIGHPVPVFSGLSIVAIIIFTVIVFILSILFTIIGFIRRSK